ncbi:MAG: hypothetical protein ACRDO7_15135 [Nocardioidaceae bacterium]
MSISEYDQRVGANSERVSGTRCGSTDGRRGRPRTRPVHAPHYTELHDHGSTELARIVAAQQRWRLTNTGELVDEDLVSVARTIDQAARAMEDLGWFAGDDDGEVWVDWDRMPTGASAKADAIRARLDRGGTGQLG